MKSQRQVLSLSAAVVVLAVVFRLLSAGFLPPLRQFFQQPEVLSFLLYAGTGYVIRFEPRQEPPPITSPAAPTEPEPTHPPAEPTTPADIAFTEEDLAFTRIQYQCSYRPDLEALLTQPLAWDLTGPEPTVLILHSHATEAYTGSDIPYSGQYRSRDPQHNMISIGQELARVLELGGIRVIHDTSLHDYPDYNTAYAQARSSIEAYLDRYPSIQLVIDLHRDAAETTSGQLVTSATAGGQRSAQLMMVVGTDASGNRHPMWQENLAVALKLTALLEQNDPGITRPIDLRAQRFNMDLTPGSLLIEVGAAGNTQQEALIAVNALAQAILALSRGSR